YLISFLPNGVRLCNGGHMLSIARSGIQLFLLLAISLMASAHSVVEIHPLTPQLNQPKLNQIVLPYEGLTFQLPASWTLREQPSAEQEQSDKHPGAPLFFSWGRTPITSKKGESVSAGLNILSFSVEKDSELAILSSLLIKQHKWPIRRFLHADRDGLKLKNAMGYLTDLPINDELTMKMFVIHALHQQKFVEVVLSSTEETFPQLEKELSSIIHSLSWTTVPKKKR
ncbi:MAG: hypothetical protein ACRC5A_16050, partial [Enterobacteriaceae bacterium]